jgi:hypothetical protein
VITGIDLLVVKGDKIGALTHSSIPTKEIIQMNPAFWGHEGRIRASASIQPAFVRERAP